MSNFFIPAYEYICADLFEAANIFAARLNKFMANTNPFVISCARKKLMLLLCAEVTVVLSVVFQARRSKRLAFVYLTLKVISFLLPITTLEGVSLFMAWTLLFTLFAIDMIIVSFAITCFAMGNPKGKRIWMRVTPKRRMLETIVTTIYIIVKCRLLTQTLCIKYFTGEFKNWARRTPRVWKTRRLYSRAERREIRRKRHNNRPFAYSRARWYRFTDQTEDLDWTNAHRAMLGLPEEVEEILPEYIDYSAPRSTEGKFVDYSATEDWEQPAKVEGNIFPNFADFTFLAELDTVSNLRYGILFILALSSLTVYSIILAGWSSNSKYAFLGALRSAAQMISYEVSISLALLPVILLSGSLNLTQIVFSQATTVWFIFPLLPVALIFLVSMLAETNRTPFDLPEAEAELVAGYNVDYSSLPFAMFFLGEYANMILISVLFCILFLGGWELPGCQSFAPFILALKATVPWIFFVLVRATLPRYRYDQLMDIGWKSFLPITGAFLVLVIGLVTFLDVAPVVEELPLAPLTSALFLISASTKRTNKNQMLTPTLLTPTLVTLPQPSLSLTQLHVTDFEHFTAESAQDSLRQLPAWLIVTYLLFLCGLLGMVYNYKNFLVTIMSVEVMYLGAVTSFVLYGLAFREPSAFIFGLLVLIFGACETAVGLGLLVAIYRFDHKIDFDSFNTLGG